MKYKIIIILFLLVLLSMPLSAASAQEITPSVVDTTIAVDAQVRQIVDAWLAAEAPVPLPYWAITYFKQSGYITYVSLVALNIDDPDEPWRITDTETAAWMGTIIINPDTSVEIYSDTDGQIAARYKVQAIPLFAPGGGSNISFPWQSGGTMMYGPRGVHAAGSSGYASGMSAVDFVGGDDMGSGVAPNHAYAVAPGIVDYVCTDDTTTLVRTTNEATNDAFVYAHLLDNESLEMDHSFSKGSMVGSLKYGSFDDNCGWAEQTAKHYHLHFGFKPASGSFRMENCILSTSSKEWTCGTKTVKTGQFLTGGGGVSGSGDDTGNGVAQPSFWDYFLIGAIQLWDRTVIQALPSHNAIQYTYVIYSTVKLMLKIARVMIYSNLNLYWFMAVVFFGFGIKILFGIAEFIVFLFKAWKSLVPIIGA